MTDSGAGSVSAGDRARGETREGWTIDITNDHGSRTYVVTDNAGQQRYAHEEQLPGWAVRALGRDWLAQFAKLADGYYTWSRSGSSKDDEVLAASAASSNQAWLSAASETPVDSQLQKGLRDAWKAPLEQRAALVRRGRVQPPVQPGAHRQQRLSGSASTASSPRRASDQAQVRAAAELVP